MTWAQRAMWIFAAVAIAGVFTDKGWLISIGLVGLILAAVVVWRSQRRR